MNRNTEKTIEFDLTDCERNWKPLAIGVWGELVRVLLVSLLMLLLLLRLLLLVMRIHRRWEARVMRTGSCSSRAGPGGGVVAGRRDLLHMRRGIGRKMRKVRRMRRRWRETELVDRIVCWMRLCMIVRKWDRGLLMSRLWQLQSRGIVKIYGQLLNIRLLGLSDEVGSGRMHDLIILQGLLRWEMSHLLLIDMLRQRGSDKWWHLNPLPRLLRRIANIHLYSSRRVAYERRRHVAYMGVILLVCIGIQG